MSRQTSSWDGIDYSTERANSFVRSIGMPDPPHGASPGRSPLRPVRPGRPERPPARNAIFAIESGRQRDTLHPSTAFSLIARFLIAWGWSAARSGHRPESRPFEPDPVFARAAARVEAEYARREGLYDDRIQDRKDHNSSYT